MYLCVFVNKHKDGNVNAPTANWQQQELQPSAATRTATTLTATTTVNTLRQMAAAAVEKE